MPDHIRRRLVLSLAALPGLAGCHRFASGTPFITTSKASGGAVPEVPPSKEGRQILGGDYPIDSEPTITDTSGDKETHGATITLTGSGFGAKEHAGPVVYDHGHQAFEYGKLNNFAASYPLTDGMPLDFLEADDVQGRIYHSIAGPHNVVPGRTPPFYAKTGFSHRHSYMQAHYVCRKHSFLGEPEAFNNEPESFTPIGYRNMYAAWWFRPNVWVNKHEGFKLLDRTGKFRGSTSGFDRGERFTIPGSRAGHQPPSMDASGYVIDTDGDWIYLDYDMDKSTNTRFKVGKEIVGLESGATAKIPPKLIFYKDATPTNPENFTYVSFSKFCRIWNEEGGGGDVRTTITARTHIGSGVISDDYYKKDDEGFNDKRLTPHEWHLMETEYSKDGLWTLWIDGIRECLLTWNPYEAQPEYVTQQTPGPTVKLVGFNGPGLRYQIEIGEFYQDSTLQRVMVANAPTLEQATKWELQLPTDWHENRISFSMFRGAFSKGEVLYVFVANAAGIYNTKPIKL